MSRYYANFDRSGVAVSIGTGSSGTEITKEQYDALNAEMDIQTEYFYSVLDNPDNINLVPAELRPGILSQVKKWKTEEERRKQREAEAAQADVSPEEIGRALEAIM